MAMAARCPTRVTAMSLPAARPTTHMAARARLPSTLRARTAAARPAAAARPTVTRQDLGKTSPAHGNNPQPRPCATCRRICASSVAPPPAAPEGIKWGADLKKLGTCVAIGVALWAVPAPAGVSLQAWHLLSIFIATIAGIITTPLPLGAVAMLGLAASMLTNVLTFSAAFSAFASEVRSPWHLLVFFCTADG